MVEAVLARRPNSPGRREAAEHPAWRRTRDPQQAGAPLPVPTKGGRHRCCPQTNRPAGGRRVDCRWPEHRLTVELDSYRYHHSRHAWEQDRRREREARARGDEFRRYTYGDVFEHPAAMLAELRKLLPVRTRPRTAPARARTGPPTRCRAPSPASGIPARSGVMPGSARSMPGLAQHPRGREVSRVAVGVDVDAHRRARRSCGRRPSCASSTPRGDRRTGRSPDEGRIFAEHAADPAPHRRPRARGGRHRGLRAGQHSRRRVAQRQRDRSARAARAPRGSGTAPRP